MNYEPLNNLEKEVEDIKKDDFSNDMYDPW